jgi:uncharacterized circularly permuted ATP-grasp superfamily protein
MLEQAIADYHALLDQNSAREMHHQLLQQQKMRYLMFGQRPICTVLRPRLLTTAQYQLLQNACHLLTEAMNTIASELLKNPALRTGLALTAQENALIEVDPGYAEPSAHSRMDTFLTTDGHLQCVEFNGESPAAIAYEDVLSELFLELPIVQQFQKQYPLQALPAREHLLNTMLQAWRDFGGVHKPVVAILDWPGLPTYSEFVLFQRYFDEHRIEAIICSPDDLHYADQRLFVSQNNRRIPIDLVYKRVLTSEFLTRYGAQALEHPLSQAYRDGSICLFNSFRAKLLHKKSIFALLSEPQFQDLLSAEQRQAVAAHIPWTRFVSEGQTTYQDETIDLLEFARNNQDRLVLKPNDEYGGKGIVIGWEASPDQWQQALADALRSPFVLQERVRIAYEDYPAYIDEQLQFAERLVDSDPFIFGTQVGGCMSRLATSTLLNVTAGGGSTIPTFVIAK